MNLVNNNTDAYYQTAGDYVKVADSLTAGRFKIIDRHGQLNSVGTIGFIFLRIFKAIGLYSGVLDLAAVKPRIQTFLDYGLRQGFEVAGLVEKSAAQRWFQDMRGESLRQVIKNLDAAVIEKCYANIFPLKTPEQQAETRARFELEPPSKVAALWKTLNENEACQYVDYFTPDQIKVLDEKKFRIHKDKFFSTSTPEEKAKTQRLIAAMAPEQTKGLYSRCFDKGEVSAMLTDEQFNGLYSWDRTNVLMGFSIPITPGEIEKIKMRIQACPVDEIAELFFLLLHSCASPADSRDKMKFLIPILTPAQANKVFDRICSDKELCGLFIPSQIETFDCFLNIKVFLLSSSTPEGVELVKKIAPMLTHKQLNSIPMYTSDVKFLLSLTDSQLIGIEDDRLSYWFLELTKNHSKDASHLVKRLSNPTINKVLPTLLKTRILTEPEISASWLTPDQLRNLSPSMLLGLARNQVKYLFHSTTSLEKAETKQLFNRLSLEQFDAIKSELSGSQIAALPDRLFARIDISGLRGYEAGELLDADSQEEAKEIQRRLKLFSRSVISAAMYWVSSAILRAYLKELFPDLNSTERQKLLWLNDGELFQVFLDAVFLNKRPQFIQQQRPQSSQSYFNAPSDEPTTYQKRISEAKPTLLADDEGMSEKYVAFKNKIRQSTPPSAKELLGFAPADQVTKEQVKRKWQLGSMVVHPDRVQDARRPEATQLFNCLTAAYDELNATFD